MKESRRTHTGPPNLRDRLLFGACLLVPADMGVLASARHACEARHAASVGPELRHGPGPAGTRRGHAGASPADRAAARLLVLMAFPGDNSRARRSLRVNSRVARA